MTSVATKTDSDARVEAIWAFYGDAPRMSDWLAVTQEMVNQYCSAVWDSDWMHIDVDRARRDSPFGSTVAPGFWTLSVLPHLMRMAVGTEFPPGTAAAINYGFDRIRFPGPVLIGSRIRLQLKLIAVTPRENGRYMIRTESTVEVENRDKPALVADWKFLLVYRD
jgi:acyl dehydratase